MSEHTINLERVDKMFARRRYRAWCSCGGYQSRPFNFPGQAESAGLEHARAKGVTR